MAIDKSKDRSDGGTVYVSITGLRLNRPWHVLRFWRHALPSMIEARRADGNIATAARRVDGVYHTLSVWESETAMKRFLYRGAHGRAIRAFRGFATGRTCGYKTTVVPSWPEALKVWAEKGRDY